MSAEHVVEVVRRAQGGDAEAFAALYEEYAPQVARFLSRRLHGSDEVAEDLTADIFVKVFEKLGRYDDRGLPFAAWLFRVARNHLVDHLRTLPRRAADSLDELVGSSEPGMDAPLGQVLDRHMLEVALACLTPIQREVVTLRFLDGRRGDEVAAITGRTEHAVKKLQMRGLMALRRILDPDWSRAGERAAILAA